MQGIDELKAALEKTRPVAWEELPDISMYMDQVISYLPRQLISFEDAERLTPAMVNNYIKDGLLPRADGKRYSRSHLASLTAICALKQVLSMREMKKLLSTRGADTDARRQYDHFRQALDAALSGAAGTMDDPPSSDEALSLLALDLALRSYAAKISCQRILDLLQRDGEPEKKRKKEKA